MANGFDGVEKRKFKRIVFSAKDEVTGVVSWFDNTGDLFTYQVSDIGAGGMRFILSKEDAPDIIGFNDTLFLRKIKGKSQLEFVADVELQVRWVIEHEMFVHMVIGCEFINIAEAVQHQIDQFVESELALKTSEL